MIRSQMLKWPRTVKRCVALLCDIALCLVTVWVAYYLRTGVFHQLHSGVLAAMTVSLALALSIFLYMGLYQAVFRYEGIASAIAITQAMAMYTLFYFLCFTVIGVDKVPRTVGIIQPILLFAGIALSRGLARAWLSGEYQLSVKKSNLPNVIIYGAGDAGRQLMSVLESSHRVCIKAFIDDNKAFQGLILCGVTVYSPKYLLELSRKFNVQTVLLAIPSASAARRKEIVEQLSALNFKVRTLPALSEIASGKISYASLREVSIEELLGRDPVEPIPNLMTKTIAGKTVMVTGAGGSIGSELCRQIVRIKPKSLLLVERSEFAVYAVYHEIMEKIGADGVEVVPFLADVRDEKRMTEIMKTWGVQTVYHAAAYKHVPMVEHNPLEGVRNNVYGTWACARVARLCNVEEFVLISTDKAVRPTNVMGATKRLCELVLQAMASENCGNTIFTMVRFGNVLGSSGSVVPRFRQQIRDGGPITLTHRDIVRFFMTIPEASQLVIQAASLGRGGDVFLLDMGNPIRIEDLAKRMITLSGFTVKDENNLDGDIEIKVTGLRPGEKLYEELLIRDNPQKTEHARIFRANEVMLPAKDLIIQLKSLEEGLDNMDREKVLAVVKTCVPEYTSKGGNEDWVVLKEGL